jgi:phenylpropionate dioxygenase-like ring-hydroxylating dioxygenase large terminal subunit
MKVCRYDEGNTPVFSCPYHGWSYSTDGNLVSVPGELIGVPQFRTAYHGELKKEDWGLVSVPKMHNYKGSIWACWDEQAPDFLDYIGHMRYRLDATFDDNVEMFGGVQKWRMPCNWKFAAENFIGDFYHGTPTHRSVDLVGISPSGPSVDRHLRGSSQSHRIHLSVPEGHGTVGNLLLAGTETEYQPAYPNHPAVDEYYKKRHDEWERKLKDQPRISGVATIFPNFSFGGPSGIAVWQPVGPHMVEAWRWFMVDKDAPKEVKDVLRHYQLRYSGPSGMTEQDDAENWNYASYASNGTVARRYPYNYAQGVGHETTIPELPGAFATEKVSIEQNARGMYKRWADFMSAESWDELRLK